MYHTPSQKHTKIVGLVCRNRFARWALIFVWSKEVKSMVGAQLKHILGILVGTRLENGRVDTGGMHADMYVILWRKYRCKT